MQSSMKMKELMRKACLKNFKILIMDRNHTKYFARQYSFNAVASIQVESEATNDIEGRF